MAAKYADGYNLPYLPPEGVANRLETLAAECTALDRDPSEIETSVNVGFYMSGEQPPPHIAPGSLQGSTQQAIDRIGAYADTGIGGLNLAFRPPIDFEAFEAFIEEVLPVFHDPV